MDTFLLVLQIAAGVLSGAVVALHAIAPLTKSDRDDQWLAKLRVVESWLFKLLPKRPDPKA